MESLSNLRPLTDPTSLASVIITSKLAQRSYRGPNFEAENKALVALMQCLASTPENVLDLLTQKAMELCRAHSAGISIEEGCDPASVFRWRSVSGAWKKYAGGTLPRWNSPCATVLDRATPLLMANLDRAYPIPAELNSEVSEVLLVPLRVRAGTIVGTIWVVSHEPIRTFDREDLRLMESLAAFGGAAYHTLTRPATDNGDE